MVDDSIQRTQIRSLQTEGHEEADTAIIFYGRMFSRPGKNMCVRCDDTDVGVLLANHQKGMSGSVYLDMGLNSKNNRCMWDMKQLGGTLSPAVSMIFCTSMQYNYTVIQTFSSVRQPYCYIIQFK